MSILSNRIIDLNSKKELKHYYVKKEHENLPHIVKFSGGKTSGMLLFKMLENNMLTAQRGDVVIFNNTSAEAVETYDFVMKCKEVCEQKYGIPFFILELYFYEDSIKGVYTKVPTFKFVNNKPFSNKNPNGYHFNGEIFESLISYNMFLPSIQKRVCTKELKMFVTYEFFRTWCSICDKRFFKNKIITKRGHYGKTSRIDFDDLYEKHIKNNGKTSREDFDRKKAFCFDNNYIVREEQNTQDFTAVDLSNINFDSSYEFCSFIGFRADEPHRLTKMKNRINDEYNLNYNVSYVRDNYGYSINDNFRFEHSYMPLMEFGYTNDDVIKFWDKMNWKLDLPIDGTLSNCTYCFMKGTDKLITIAKNEKPYVGNPTPRNIDWWINIEEFYQKELEAKENTIKGNIYNFFGANEKISYRKIKECSLTGKKLECSSETLPCNCTD